MMYHKPQSAFAMLFTVLVVSLILSIGLAISNVTLKQTILSSLAKDSQSAFYQADAGVECGMYQDTTLSNYPRGSAPSAVPASFTCGGKTMTRNDAASSTDYFVFTETSLSNASSPCVTIIFDKAFSLTQSRVQARGYNRCDSSSRRVERALEIKY